MFHIIIRGKIESENKEFAEELDKFISEHNKLDGKIYVYEISKIKSEND